MRRQDGRSPTDLRPISFETGFILHHPGSVLVVATSEDRVPPFRMNTGGGWLTADYAMLPASTHERRRRERDKQDGRSVEIQRLVGRALRNVVNLDKLGQRTVNVDCDVLQADGGTRTAAITGAWVALRIHLEHLARKGALSAPVDRALTNQVAAVSLGVKDGVILTDLDYSEDSRADTDMNLVARDDGTLIEVQGTAEGKPMTRDELTALLDQGLDAISRLCALQREAVQKALGK